MNARRTRLFALYWLVYGVKFTYREAIMSLNSGAFEPYQLDELAMDGQHLCRYDEDAAEDQIIDAANGNNVSTTAPEEETA